MEEKDQQINEIESKQRYSQMTEDEAAQQFEKRRQMLMQGLEKQHQLITKKGHQEKPPRHSSAKNIKNQPLTPQQATSSQNEFVVYNNKNNSHSNLMADTSQKKFISKQQTSVGYSSAQHIKQQPSQGEYTQKSVQQPQSQEIFYKEDRLRTPKPISYKADQNNSIQKISNIKKQSKNMSNYLSHESESQYPSQEQPQPYPEPSPIRLSTTFNNQKVGVKAKQNILGEIGSIDLEIKRMMREEETVPKPKLLAVFNATSTSKQFPNKASAPYYDVRKKVQPDNSSFLKDSRAESSKITSQRPSNQDIYGQLSYAQKASNRKSINDPQKSDSKSAYLIRDQSKSKITVVKDSQKDSNIKPLNITIQFQQSIDNSQNLFSPTVQINKSHSSFSKKKSPSRAQDGERLIVTDRKRQVDNSSPTIIQSKRKDNQISKQAAATIAMQLLQNSSLKSLSPFQDKMKSTPKITKTQTPQPRTTAPNINSSYQHQITMEPEDMNSNSSKSNLTVYRALQKNQMSFQEVKPKGIEAQIDEAVKLYNNLKQLITSKSGLQVKPSPTTTNYRKLTTLDQFEDRNKLQQKENDPKQDKLYLANDLHLRTKNIFFQNFYDYQRISKDKESGLIKKFEEKQKNLFEQVKEIQDQLEKKQV